MLHAGLTRESAAADYDRAARAAMKATPSYAFTLIDLPPDGANPGARYLARHAEFAVLVAWRVLDLRDSLRAAARLVQASGVRIVGAVLSRGTFERGVLSWAADRLRLRS
jgi:hypothetical protein